jgi:hypothetical protein|nr:MAG TPA: hypothetical protein [Caudoviricetes sp.]
MDDRQFDILDILNILSFVIGVKNLNENLSQNTAEDLLSVAVKEIHEHLSEQDRKIDLILKKLGVDYNDENKKVS